MKSQFGTKRNIVLVGEPHPSSMAALVLLTESLGRAAHSLDEWLDFREWYFDRHEPLTCMWCGRTNLARKVEDMTDKAQLETLATIEHITPLSGGGERWDPSNLGIACWPCNNNRKDKMTFRGITVGEGLIDPGEPACPEGAKMECVGRTPPPPAYLEATVAQLAEQRFRKPQVGSSNLFGGSIEFEPERSGMMANSI